MGERKEIEQSYLLRHSSSLFSSSMSQTYELVEFLMLCTVHVVVCYWFCHDFWLQSVLFLLVFFDSHAGISLLGDVNWVLARLITRGDVVLRLLGSVACSFRSRIELCRDSAQIDRLSIPIGRSGPNILIMYSHPLLRNFDVFIEKK